MTFPEIDEFETTLFNLIPEAENVRKKIDRVVFKNVAQKYANCADCISTKGSYHNSGRYHIGKKFADFEIKDKDFSEYRHQILYLSCNLYACLAEFEYYALKEADALLNKDEKIANALPRTIISVKINVRKVLDLTNEKLLRKMKISKRILIEDWEAENYDFKPAKTQIIGKVAKEKGFEALLVPSARWKKEKSINLLDNGEIGKFVGIINQNHLPACKLDIFERK
jgi:hypothetical protein